MSCKTSIPYPTKDEESYWFLTLGFNVTRAKQLLIGKEPEHTITPATVPQICRIDEKYALSDAVDLSIPVILASLPGGFGTLLLDGNHRVYKAQKTGMEELPAYLLSSADLFKCCFTRDVWRRLFRHVDPCKRQ